MANYQQKYLKYKNKYIELKNEINGGSQAQNAMHNLNKKKEIEKKSK
jgi:hypothetical protein